jgi:predicted Zn-dependent peptidase
LISVYPWNLDLELLMRSLPFPAIALLVLAAAPLQAQKKAPPIDFESFTLDNGLSVIVHEDHSTPIVAVTMWYDVGSAHEEEGRSGFAHLFEHMLSQETENLGQGELRRLVTAAGGTRNATTNYDRTAYYEVLPSNRLNLALWLHAERLGRLQVTKENFEREREVVKEERRLRIENQPYSEGVETLDTLVADWPPYNHTVIGSMADLNAATADDVRAFYRKYYVPNNATLVVAGDVTVDQVRQMAEEYLGGIPRGADPPPLPPLTPTPRTDGERRTTVQDELANVPAYIAGFNIPPISAEDSYALELLSSVFSQGESSRLHQRLVKDEQAALVVFSQLDSRLGPGVFFFAALPNQGVAIERIEALIDEEVEKLKTEGVTERELQKAKNQLRSNEIMSRQTVFAKANELQTYRYYYGDVSQINDNLESYMDVKVDDIRRVAREYLATVNRTVVVVVPAAGGETPEPNP